MKVQLPWFGKATGSSAGTIYQSYWGKTYTRSFPFSFHYPDTSKQQKTQFDFFKIQRVWWVIYNKMKEFIPRSQRHNRNTFNLLSAGLYASFMTYTQKAWSNVKEVWGIDDRKSVVANLTFDKISILDTHYYIDVTLHEFKGTRQFYPKFYHLLLCNITQQDIVYTYDYFTTSHVKADIKVDMKWQRSDIIVAYIAYSSDEFFTNYYLCGL